MKSSGLQSALARMANRAAAAAVAQGRINHPALNQAIVRRLGGLGTADSLFADPVFEVARDWKPGSQPLGELSGNLLHPRLVDALDAAEEERMPRSRFPYLHQYEAWEAARAGRSYLVSSGTGSGKTECFMVPMLDDLLREDVPGLLRGVRAIIIYPLNALIESQRERLGAWTAKLKDRISFAMYNGNTPETPGKVDKVDLKPAELGHRESIRTTPPSILVTNITMLEYMLLRAKDRGILDRSQGLLRWIVLDEAHGYVGAQAAEMALLLRRVRAAFGVTPEQVRLVATSATISDGENTQDKLKSFLADLAGRPRTDVQVIEGKAIDPVLPSKGPDHALQPDELAPATPEQLWDILAPHPRVQQLRGEMATTDVAFTRAGEILFKDPTQRVSSQIQVVLDAVAAARSPQGQRLSPWRAHLFQRSVGGLWVCLDPQCPHRDDELRAEGADWGWGAVWQRPRERCSCGAPAFELVSCQGCGKPHLRAQRRCEGVEMRLSSQRSAFADEFAVDIEPAAAEEEQDTNSVFAISASEPVLLLPGSGAADQFLDREILTLRTRLPEEMTGWLRLRIIDEIDARGCCVSSDRPGLSSFRLGPAFFLGTQTPLMLEALSQTGAGPAHPFYGRRALSFSDSRQGTARLAAKLQQEAERALTRAFLYHKVQEDTGLSADKRAKLERRLAAYLQDPTGLEDDIASIKTELAEKAQPVLWKDLADQFAKQPELAQFATKVWEGRVGSGDKMAREPLLLAQMFLFREMFRRPRVQNNPETMGLLRLGFPDLEKAAEHTVPRALQEARVDAEGWKGLLLAAIDAAFRENLAVDMNLDLVRWVAPRGGVLQSICKRPEDRGMHAKMWPKAEPFIPNKPGRLLRLIYSLIGGDWNDADQRGRAAEILEAAWQLITARACVGSGPGQYCLDFNKAAISRLDDAWLCPVTRRPFGYSVAGRSPYAPEREMFRISLPRLPLAKPMGMTEDECLRVREWLNTAPEIIELRNRQLWTNLHDRVAEYAPFLRTQEHSAQIQRAVLKGYEAEFRKGDINLLTCTTTMEMGVDISNVGVVVNTNVPPSVSNYRQRVGRAGRRGEDFAFAVTFCRDLPWDKQTFRDPLGYLGASIAAPAVRLDSAGLVRRHVHAALLGQFLRGEPHGFKIRTTIGGFFGATAPTINSETRATQSTDGPEASAIPPEGENPPVERFLAWLAKLDDDATAKQIKELIRDTALKDERLDSLTAETGEALKKLLKAWREEYQSLLDVAAAAVGREDFHKALLLNAKRMYHEYLLGEIARRGFTPAYGFPVDVVTFEHLAGHLRETQSSSETITYGDIRGAASRDLNSAIREYAPGNELVIDGLVHRSEGLKLAWAAQADESGIEDLRWLWNCADCGDFGLARNQPAACPTCNNRGKLGWRRTIRPAGFVGERSPHTSYESLGHVPMEPVKLNAGRAKWHALPDGAMGRLRADPAGLVITQGSGANRMGYALCLACGRAVPEIEAGDQGFNVGLPQGFKEHRPLSPLRGKKNKDVRYCPGGQPGSLQAQRHLRLVHDTYADVFELQLPADVTSRATAFALAAALREALCEKLGCETREIGVGADYSQSTTKERRVSAFLFDRAAGGAGLTSRLVEFADYFNPCLKRAAERLACREECASGCPSCILRPDISLPELDLDRPAAHTLAQRMLAGLNLPDELKVFGANTRHLGIALPDWLDRQHREGRLRRVTLFLHGHPGEWDLDSWEINRLAAKMALGGVTLAASAAALAACDLTNQLALHRLTSHASLAVIANAPKAGDHPILAIIGLDESDIGVAATSPEDAIPGLDWGSGDSLPLLRGPAPKMPAQQAVSSEEIIQINTGNAKMIRLGDALDGSVSTFGKAFWSQIQKAWPQATDRLRQNKVTSVTYSDRYLVTPLALRLLRQVLDALPGQLTGKTVISTSRCEPSQQSSALHHNFPEKQEEVMKNLFQEASIRILGRHELNHAREMTLTLGSGETLRLWLDQGFGGWRTSRHTPHDFRKDAKIQALAIRQAAFDVQRQTDAELPVVIDFSEMN